MKKKLSLDTLSVSSFITKPVLTRGGREIRPIDSGQLQSCDKTMCGEYYTCGLCAYSAPGETCAIDCTQYNCPVEP
jgi:hypothetical protein